jgi:outer membrane receptor protein involved in Fe transport
MGKVGNHVRTLKLVLAAGVAGSAMALALPGVAAAQQAPDARKVSISINGGELSEALIALGRQTSVEIAFLPESVAGRKVKPLRGTLTVEQALKRLLADTGLSYRQVRPGSYQVAQRGKKAAASGREAADEANIYANVPEILVQGLKSWSLNTDLPRGENEAQPYTVFTSEQIKRSGTPDLETFFRDYLGANASVGTSSQRSGVNGRDSSVNLRGLGYDSTLILVDGRRYAQPNSGVSGEFGQSSVMGIPLEQIERVEVLASSAAGQYGSNAVGGVINIILRRDFQGVETSAYLGGSTRGDGFERRLNANATLSVFEGTSLTLTGSWKKSDPVFSKDRSFVNDRLEYILERNPTYLSDPNVGLVFSTTPNIRSTSGNLVLKPQYAVNGVTNLGSSLTYIPQGFQGIDINGAGALIANAGQQNIEAGPTDAGGLVYGDRYALLTGSTQWAGSASFRSSVTDWLTFYGSGSYSKVESVFEHNTAPSSIVLRANSPVNPFTTDIEVTFPSTDHIETARSESETIQLLGGAVVDLPWRWQANFDANASWGTAKVVDNPSQLSVDYYNRLINAQTVDVLRDTLAYPIAFEMDTEGHYSRRSPSKSSFTSYTAKVAGPLAFARLWGGEPVVTLVAESNRHWFGDSLSIIDGPASGSISVTPARSQSTRSAYGEIVLPIIGADNHVPGIYGFELRLSGRYDSYKGVGANQSFQCAFAFSGTLTPEQLQEPCPGPDTGIVYETTRNSTFNPVIAAKWSVLPDIAFRGSYSTGYKPPFLTQLVGIPGLDVTGFGIPITNGIIIRARDPLRGNEPIGEDLFGLFRFVEGQSGGNPDVDPQRSTSWSFGTILTPRFIKGLTLRADWSKITIDNAYYDPIQLLNPNTPEEQQSFNDFMTYFPDRFQRAAPTPGDPFGVGRIIYVDGRTANLTRISTESIDFSGEYRTPIGRGQLQINASGTVLLNLSSQLTPWSEVERMDGVVFAGSIYNLGDSLRFRGNLSAVYSTDDWSIGARARYFSGYYLRPDYAVEPSQGSARVSGQATFDLFGSWKIFKNTNLSGGINNVMDKRPPLDVTRGTGYAPYGNAMLRSFFVNVTQRF